MFSSLSKPITLAWLSISEWYLLLFGIVLVVGLIGEFLADHKGKKYSKLKKRKRLFEILVIAGVAGELFADGGIFAFGQHLQMISDRENEVMAGVAAQAKKESSLANERAALTESNNLVLEAKIQPRRITPEMEAAMVNFMKPLFPKGKIQIGARDSDVESWFFMSQVAGVLNKSGFDVETNDVMAGGPTAMGVWFLLQNNNPAPIPALVISKSFEMEKLNFGVDVDSNRQVNSFEIWIGTKP